MKRDNTKKLDELLNLFEKVLIKMEKMNVSNQNMRGKFAELYVASKLKEHAPQIGDNRDIINADIYLPDINKRIEVKSSIKKEDYWDWSFGFKQIKNKKFDYCVLVGLSKEGKVSKVFVLDYDEIKRHPLERPDSFGTNTYIIFSKNYSDFDECKTKDSQVEMELNDSPQKFLDKWEKIK